MTNFDKGSWSIVSMIKEDTDKINWFITYYLATDVHEIIIFLDQTDEHQLKTIVQDSRVSLIHCDLEYWKRLGIEKPKLFTDRQLANLKYAYVNILSSEWVAHIDCDEYLYSETGISDYLSNVGDDILSVKILPFERILTNRSGNLYGASEHLSLIHI